MENVRYNKFTCALWPDPGHFWNMGKLGWHKGSLSWLTVVHTKLMKWASAWWAYSGLLSIALSDIWIVFGVRTPRGHKWMEILKVKVWRGERRRGRICRCEWNPCHRPVRCHMCINHGDERKEWGESGGREQEKGASPTEHTAGLLSCVRGEESNLQVPNYWLTPEDTL